MCLLCITVFKWILAIVALLPLLPGGASASIRAASINLCTDQYLILLAEPGQIVSVSALAADPLRSARANEAITIPFNHGTAEEMAAASPDIVLASAFSNPNTVALIRRLGMTVLVLPQPVDFAGIVANVRRAAEALGVPGRGEAIVAMMEQKIVPPVEDAAPPVERPLVAIVEPGGYSQGPGTLLDEAVTRAGGEGLARRLGLKGYSTLPLERLVAAPVDLLIEPPNGRSAPSLGFAMLRHPAIRDRFAHTVRLALPPALTDCPSPASADLVPILRQAIQAVEDPRR